MTRKDYIIIANAMKRQKPSLKLQPEQYYQWLNIVADLCYHCEKDNPRFDKDKFQEACGV